MSASTDDRNKDIISKSDKSQSHQRSRRAFCGEFHVEEVSVWKWGHTHRFSRLYHTTWRLRLSAKNNIKIKTFYTELTYCVEWGSESLCLSHPYLSLSLIRDGQLKPFRATVWSILSQDLPKESEWKRGLYLWSHSFSVPGERAAIERFVLTFHAGLSSCYIALWHGVVWLWVMRGWRGMDRVSSWERGVWDLSGSATAGSSITEGRRRPQEGGNLNNAA